MNFKVIRRGFTVVEIVIVIAVIAVLAGVMVPTISNIVKKAQQSVDEQLVNNLNKILMAEEVIEGKNPYMHAAVLDLAENGYDLDSLKMSDENNILIYKEKAFQYNNTWYPGAVYGNDSNDYESYYEGHFFSSKYTWKIFTSDDYINGKLSTKQNFSIYWGEKNLPLIGDNGDFEFQGFDLGYCTELFTGDNGNPSQLIFRRQDSIIHGNIDTIQVCQSSKHFGYANKLIINYTTDDYTTGNRNYFEYGSVKIVEMSSLYTADGFTGSKVIAGKGAKFGQTKDEINSILKGTDRLVDNGAEFGVSF